ncbi:MAG: hypothetical protein ACK5TN_11365 [Acidobacteriota bacterium]
MGFQYAKREHYGGKIGRALHGYGQAHTTYHLLPQEGQRESFIEFEAGRDAAGDAGGGLCMSDAGGGVGPILAIAKKDAGAKHGARLKAAKVDVSVYPHRIRVSPSVYNDEGDVERLLEALS